MMSPHGPSAPVSTPLSTAAMPPQWMDAPPSLEERLRVVRERCRLLADVFSIQAEATFLACHVALSADAFNALTDLCRSSADDLERLAQDIPGSIANWSPGVLVDLDGVDPDRGVDLERGVGPDRGVDSEGLAWDRRKNPVDGDERP